MKKEQQPLKITNVDINGKVIPDMRKINLDLDSIPGLTMAIHTAYCEMIERQATGEKRSA